MLSIFIDVNLLMFVLCFVQQRLRFEIFAARAAAINSLSCKLCNARTFSLFDPKTPSIMEEEVPASLLPRPKARANKGGKHPDLSKRKPRKVKKADDW